MLRPTVRRLTGYAALALAAAGAAACGEKGGADDPGLRGANTNAAGADSGSSGVVMQSAPPTRQDSSLAVPGSGATTDTNRSGMAVDTGTASKAAKGTP